MSLRTLYFVISVALMANHSSGQIKIGDNPQNLDGTSLLELESTSKVLVVNRMTTAQMNLLIPLAGALVFNIDESCLHYFDGDTWQNLCDDIADGASISITDNGDGTYTVNDGVVPPFTFDGSAESITTLVSNGDDTYTYTNENNVETTIDLNNLQNQVISTLVDNGDGTFTYTDEANDQTTIDLRNSTSTLVNNNDGTYTYTDEQNNQTIIDINSNRTTIISTLDDNGDGTYTYTDEANTQTILDLNNGASSSISTLIDNRDGTYTYTDENNTQTTFFTGNRNGRHFGDTGSVFFANNTTGDPTQDNDNLFWDNVNKRLGIGTPNPGTALQVQGIIRSFRIGNGTGTSDFPGYHFSRFFNTGMYAPQTNGLGFVVAGTEIIRVTPSQRVGINTTVPQATLHVGGDLIVDGIITTPNGTYKRDQGAINTIRRLVKSKEAVNDDDSTLILTPTVRQVVFKDATLVNEGTLYIFKNLSSEEIRLNQTYIDRSGFSLSTLRRNSVTWLQSDGTQWQQVN